MLAYCGGRVSSAPFSKAAAAEKAQYRKYENDDDDDPENAHSVMPSSRGAKDTGATGKARLRLRLCSDRTQRHLPLYDL
jgi:hypothetical protein